MYVVNLFTDMIPGFLLIFSIHFSVYLVVSLISVQYNSVQAVILCSQLLLSEDTD